MIGITKDLIDIKDDYNETALMNAAIQGHGMIVELLLKHGADVDVRSSFWGYQAIHYATYYGHLDVAKLIAKKHPRVLRARNKRDETPLELAIRFEHNHIVDWLQTELWCNRINYFEN